MVDLKNVGAEYDVIKKTTKSSAHIKLADSTSAKLKLTTPGNLLNVELEAKRWGIVYDLNKKDVELKGVWKFKQGDLRIKQRVPGLKTELVPSPEVQWKSHIVKNKKFGWELEPSYCFQARNAKIDQTLELNGGKQKLKLETNGKAGVKATVGTLTAKVETSWAKQLSVKYSRAAGPTLTHELEPSKQVLLKSTVGVRSRDLNIVAEVKPGKVAGVKPKITLGSKVSAKDPLHPTVVIAGLSFDV